MNKILKLGIITVCLVGIGIFLYSNGQLSGPADLNKVKIEGKTFNVRIADTPEEQQLGLGGVSSMSNDEGMLFIFPESTYHSFWMKDTLIPLDIIWIDEDFSIIHIEHNAKPDSYPTVFTPNLPSLYVLELNGGISEKYNFERGQKVELKLQKDLSNTD